MMSFVMLHLHAFLKELLRFFWVELWPLWRSQCVAIVRHIRSRRSGFLKAPRLMSRSQERWAWIAVGLSLIGLVAVWLDPVLLPYRHAWSREAVDVMQIVTHLGSSGLYLFPLGGLMLLAPWLAQRASSRKLRAGFFVLGQHALLFFLAIVGSGLLSTLLKRLIGRARPRLADVMGALHFDPATAKSALASFPSGHTTTAFAVAIFLSVVWSRWRVLFVLLAVMVALSRLIVGAHHLSDVLGGAWLGASFSWLFLLFCSRYTVGYRVQAPGRIVPKGLSLAKMALLSLTRSQPQRHK